MNYSKLAAFEPSVA